MITTLNKIRAHSPCRDGWEKLLRHLNKTAADDDPLSIAAVLNSNGLDDTLWCLRAVEGHDREMRLYAVWCARQVQHLMTDPRSLTALEVAEEYARGRASTAKVTEAAWAAWAALAAESAAWAASAYAAEAARGAAALASAAAAAAWAAEAALASAAEAEAAESAAAVWAASAYAACVAGTAKAAQADELRRICEEIEAGRDPYPMEAKP